MIEAKLLREKGILVLTPGDKLTVLDFEQVRALVDPYLEGRGVLEGLLIDAEDYPGWEEFVNLLSQIRFVQQYEHKINRVAAVTDSRVLGILPRIAEHFVAAEVRQFAYRDRDRALAWLESGRDL